MRSLNLEILCKKIKKFSFSVTCDVRHLRLKHALRITRMKEEIDISEAREIWNSPSPQMDKDQIDRAYESIGGYILRSRISKGIKAFIGGAAAACLVIAGVFIGRIEKPEMVAEVYAPEYVEYMAANGDIKEVLLADGTRVYLNAQSRLNC